MQGKIIKGIGGFYYVHDGHETVYECRAKGIFRSQGIKPLVGDNVEMDILSREECLGNIAEIFPRKNSLIRPAAANVDQALVIFAVKEPDPNLNLLDRFLVMMGMKEIPCRICFNKADLSSDGSMDHLVSVYEKAGYETYPVSTYTGEGLEKVRTVLRGRTTVMAGPSGVGKSSVMNAVNPGAAMETGAVSEKIKRGRHTTRHTELFWVEDNTFLLDTPGFSSLTPGNLECRELRWYYPEMEKLEGQCRFQGCVHVKEPDCAVKRAVEEGAVSRERYENYLLIYEELKQIKRY
ncbi:MAG TPA: ribosome small subunit-dependent GTPase A [Firmicutes bacterium]|nr:ribosome small subunit-dependent GTPase A [Bacillota bacterium]